MSATKIMNALETAHMAACHAPQAARCGFLEWVICLPDGANTACEARKAVSGFEAAQITSDAGTLFLQYLRDASTPVYSNGRRGGASGRRRVLH